MHGARSALIVVTSRHEDSRLRQLRAPSHDAEQLQEVLADPDVGGFEVEVLANEPEHRLRRAISTFFSNRSRDDFLLVHFSCHGLKDDDGNLYFAAPDTEIDHLDSTALPSGFVNRHMAKSRSQRIALFLDCCYSGAFSRGMGSKAGDLVDVGDRFDGRGQVVITASTAMEYAFEGDELTGEGTPSVFTSALAEGMKTGGADLDGDGLISIDEMYEYVFKQVRAATPNQTPSKWTYDVRGDFYVARSRSIAVVPLPRELDEAVASPFVGVREGAVGELAKLVRGKHRGLARAARTALAELTEDDSRRVSAAAEAILLDLPLEEVPVGAPGLTAPVPPKEAPPVAVETPPPPPRPAPAAPPVAPAPAEPAAKAPEADTDRGAVPQWTRVASGLAAGGALLALVAWMFTVKDAGEFPLIGVLMPLLIVAISGATAFGRAPRLMAGGAVMALGLELMVHYIGWLGAAKIVEGTVEKFTSYFPASAGGALALLGGIAIVSRGRRELPPGPASRRTRQVLFALVGAGAALCIAALFVKWGTLTKDLGVLSAGYAPAPLHMDFAETPLYWLDALVGIVAAAIAGLMLFLSWRTQVLSGFLLAIGVYTLLNFVSVAIYGFPLGTGGTLAVLGSLALVVAGGVACWSVLVPRAEHAPPLFANHHARGENADVHAVGHDV